MELKAILKQATGNDVDIKANLKAGFAYVSISEPLRKSTGSLYSEFLLKIVKASSQGITCVHHGEILSFKSI